MGDDHPIDSVNAESEQRWDNGPRSNRRCSETSTVVEHTRLAASNQMTGTISDIEHVDPHSPRDFVTDGPSARRRWERTWPPRGFARQKENKPRIQNGCMTDDASRPRPNRIECDSCVGKNDHQGEGG